MKTQSWITLTAAVCGLIVAAGCATPFKYNPSHVQQYPAIANNEGLEIVDGTDVRPKKERRPKWKPAAQQVVANALEDELTHAKLFQHVTVKVRDTVSSVPPQIPIAVTFRVKKLELFNDYKAGEVAGGAALGLLGLPGVFIAASIPTKFVSDAEVEFEVFDMKTRRSVFVKTYSESRSLTQNAYKGQNPLFQQTSDVLEAVVTRFVKDLCALPLCRQTVLTGT